MLSDSIFLKIAQDIATWSKCVSMHVGAVIVKDNRIVSTWYNGTPSWYINCHDYWKWKYTKDHHDWSANHEIHAEMNAILWAARKWNSIEWSTLYCTHEPCLNCTKNIMASGIEKIVYLEKHKHNDSKMAEVFIKESWGTIEQWIIDS